MPVELKRKLTQLRELDAQSQELFERMSKLSKNHILRAKKSVQEGREPDEEYLVKARRAYKELIELDEEKVDLADQMHAEIARHFDFCSTELRKFEEELKEKGQLKTPQMKTQQLARQDSTGSLADAGAEAAANLMGGSGSGSGLAPLALSGDPSGRRGRVGSFGAGDSGGPAPPGSANSHKRGRGRKVSFKEAERQRQQAEAMEQRAAAAAERAGMGGSSSLMPAPIAEPGVVPAALLNPATFTYPDAELPVAPRESSNLPLCGAVPASPDHIVAEGAKVCAKPPSTKMQVQDWILGTVLRHVPASNKYIILDEDESDGAPAARPLSMPSAVAPSPYLVPTLTANVIRPLRLATLAADPWAQESASTARQHQVPARFVLPLPLTEPSVYTAFNEFSRGVWVLALYPDTTCFYKALVHTAPSSMMGSPPPRDYLVEFEDESEASGKSEPMRVPQKYVLRLQN